MRDGQTLVRIQRCRHFPTRRFGKTQRSEHWRSRGGASSSLEDARCKAGSAREALTDRISIKKRDRTMLELVKRVEEVTAGASFECEAWLWALVDSVRMLRRWQPCPRFSLCSR